MKTTHALKLINPFFEDMWSKLKDFEVRKNDRDFKIGDRIIFVEHGEAKNYVPRFIIKDIKYILMGGQYGVATGYVVLGLKDVVIR